MGESKIPFKTNVDQPVGTASARRFLSTKRLTGLWRVKRKPLRVTKVDDTQKKILRIKWTLKWMVLLPLSVLTLLWLLVLLVLLVDFFAL